MLKFIALFSAAPAVFSPLLLIGIRKYTRHRTKQALGASIASFFTFLVSANVVGIGGNTSAVGTPEAVATADDIAEGLKYIGATLAVDLGDIGGGITVTSSAPTALGTIPENDKVSGKALIFIGLTEGVTLYGLIVVLLLLFV